MQERVIFIKPFPEMIGDDFKSGAELAGVKLNHRFPTNDPVALVPPSRIRIAHDLANALVEKESLDGTEERKDQLEAHT
jgi:hypothetical protein